MYAKMAEEKECIVIVQGLNTTSGITEVYMVFPNIPGPQIQRFRASNYQGNISQKPDSKKTAPSDPVTTEIDSLWKAINESGEAAVDILHYFTHSLHHSTGFMFRVSIRLSPKQLQTVKSSTQLITQKFDLVLIDALPINQQMLFFLSDEYDFPDGSAEHNFGGWYIAKDPIAVEGIIMKKQKGEDVTTTYGYLQSDIKGSHHEEDDEEEEDAGASGPSPTVKVRRRPSNVAAQTAAATAAAAAKAAAAKAAAATAAAVAPVIASPIAAVPTLAAQSPLVSARVEEALGRPAKASDEKLMDERQVAGLGAAAFAIAALAFLSAL